MALKFEHWKKGQDSPTSKSGIATKKAARWWPCWPADMRNPLERQTSLEGGDGMRRRRQAPAASPSFRSESGAGDVDAVRELLARSEPTALADRVAEAQLAEMYVQSALMQRKGRAETTWRSAGAVLWIIQSGLIVLATVALGCAVTFLRFILVPLALAYFISFLLTPLLAIFVRRPPRMLGRSCCGCCRTYATSAERQNRAGSCSGAAHDCLRLGRVPHVLAVALTFLLSAGILSAVVLQARSSVSAFIEHSASNNETLHKISDGLAHELSKVGINVERDTLGLPGLLSYLGLGDLLASGGAATARGGGGTGPGGAVSDAELRIAAAQKLLGVMVDSTTQLVLVLVLAAYLMVDRGDPEAYDSDGNAAEHEPGGSARALLSEIGRALHNYISSKLAVSLVAGVAVGIIYLVLGVQLAFLIGAAVCVLSFVPTVGPMVAAALPIPVLLLDQGLGVARVIALAAGWTVQLLCGNVLEMWLLGEEDGRRLTPIGLLGSLVIWASLWGAPGAVLSAPILVTTEVALAHGAYVQCCPCALLLQQNRSVSPHV
jgi:predicted PurR-regulated permease PerM